MNLEEKENKLLASVEIEILKLLKFYSKDLSFLGDFVYKTAI